MSVCRACQKAQNIRQWRDEVVSLIRAYHDEHDQVPASRDIGPPYRTRAHRAFGSWSAAVEAAGLKPYKLGGWKPPPFSLGGPDRIPITSRRGIVGWTTVDPDDRPNLTGRCWFFGSDGYAYGRDPEGGNNIAMHRFLLDPLREEPRDIDHINGDRLDNRRANLRFATRAENLQNRTAPATGSSRFRGVTRDHTRKRWQAQANLNNVHYVVGRFDSELEAAIAVQRWRDENMPFAQPDAELVRVLGAWPPIQDSEEVALWAS